MNGGNAFFRWSYSSSDARLVTLKVITHFSSGLIPYTNHFHYGNNINQFSEWKSYCCCWVINEATLDSTDVFHYSYLHHPIHSFNKHTTIYYCDGTIRIQHIFLLVHHHLYIKKNRTHHLDASDTYIILKNNFNPFPFKNNL